MLKFLLRLIGKVGGVKVIKGVILDLLTNILIKELVRPKVFAKEVHDALADKAAGTIGATRYEKLEKNMLEPFAAELLRLWKRD